MKEILQTKDYFVWFSNMRKPECDIWEHLSVCTYYWVLLLKQSGLPKWRWVLSLIWNLQLLICKSEAMQGMWETQNQCILVLLSFFGFVICVCQHYNCVSSRNNSEKHFQWWALSSKTGKDIVDLVRPGVCWTPCSFLSHACFRAQMWKQRGKTQDYGERAEEGETQFGYLLWVGYQITSSPISTCWNTFPRS